MHLFLYSAMAQEFNWHVYLVNLISGTNTEHSKSKDASRQTGSGLYICISSFKALFRNSLSLFPGAVDGFALVLPACLTLHWFEKWQI